MFSIDLLNTLCFQTLLSTVAKRPLQGITACIPGHQTQRTDREVFRIFLGFFFFKQTSKMSYYYVPQTGTDMPVLHLPDEKTHLSKATLRGLPFSKASAARLPGRQQNPTFI